MDKQIQPIRIVIADDNPILRDGLRRLLEAEPDMQVVGEACIGFEAVKLATEIKPDILLLDLAMPHISPYRQAIRADFPDDQITSVAGLTRDWAACLSDPRQDDRVRHDSLAGMEALRDLNTRAGMAGIRIILLTPKVEKVQMVEALQLGARGVVVKESATTLLIKSIHAVMSGEYWVVQDSVSNLMQCLRNLMQSINEEAKQKTCGLTPREVEIVSAVVAGYENREIGEYFKISEDTVKHHLTNIFNKLGINNRLEVALFAVNHGMPLKTIL